MQKHEDFVYDIETYSNMFSCCTVHVPTGTRWIHEVSDRINQSQHFIAFINWLSQRPGARMVGFNNEGFDYPVIHTLVKAGQFTSYDAYEKANAIIHGGKDARFAHTVWPNDRLVPQVDLYKVHHFDNMARATSLKALEIAMRSWSIVDLPYDPAHPLTPEQMTEVIEYMCHDVRETLKFYLKSKDKLEFRDTVSELYGFDATNFNDTKIGKEFFTAKLEAASPGITGTRERPKQLRQTHRPTIALNEVILPIVDFQDPEFNRIVEFMKGAVLTETKGFFKDLSCTVNGFQFDFGTGGIHGSVNRQTFYADDEFDIIDVDVASYYPSLAIAHRFYPAHLSELFCDLNAELFEERLRVGKKTDAGATIKLGLNGTYGDSNNIYSCFYDPQYTMSITINGQLLLCMLAEWIMELRGVDLIQINTDGLTARVHKAQREQFMIFCREWEQLTGLTLEDVDYSRMFIRDVNNYVAESKDGSVKLKGAYDYNVGWHQNHSSLVVPKAVEACLIHGTPVADFIGQHTDYFDFCRSTKVPRSSRLETTDGQSLQRNTRYHIANSGPGLTKVMPPLKGKENERKIGIDVGFSVNVCNDIRTFDWSNLNRAWYIDQAQKLVEAVGLNNDKE